MAITYFAVKDDSEKGFKIVATDGKLRPKGAFQKIPLDTLRNLPEDMEWLTLRKNPNPENPNQDVVVVDKALKRQILKQRIEERKARQELENGRRERRLALRQFFRDFDKNDVVTSEDIQDSLEKIVDAIKILT